MDHVVLAGSFEKAVTKHFLCQRGSPIQLPMANGSLDIRSGVGHPFSSQNWCVEVKRQNINWGLENPKSLFFQFSRVQKPVALGISPTVSWYNSLEGFHKKWCQVKGRDAILAQVGSLEPFWSFRRGQPVDFTDFPILAKEFFLWGFSLRRCQMTP